MIKDYDNMAVLIDFDGTITDRDTNLELYSQKSILKESLLELSKREEGRSMNLLERIEYVFDHIKISEEEYREFILSNFEISEGFVEFYRELEEREIPVAIISGGFSNGIEIFLEGHGIEGADIYAHRLEFDGEDIKIKFYGDPLDCCEHGPCGNCKVLRYEEFKKIKDQIIFIGDGFTDRWVASKAELLFAKSDLVEFCKLNNIDYIGWKDFNDIRKVIFG